MIRKEPLYVLACYVLWGVLGLFWKLFGDVNAFCLLGWRTLFSLVVVLLLVHFGKDWDLLKATIANRPLLVRLCVAGALVFANWGMYIWCISQNHLLEASLAYYMTPLFSIVLGMVLHGERLLPRQWVAVGLTLVGVSFAVISSGQVPWLSLILGGTMATYAAVKKPVKLPFQISLAVETMAMFPVSIGLLLWSSYMATHPDYMAMGWRLWLFPISGVMTIIPLMCFAKGIGKTSLTMTGILMYVNPTLQMIIAVLLGDVFTFDDAILFGFVWAGLLVYIVPDLWQIYQHRGELSCE